jgi:hypothetical protein
MLGITVGVEQLSVAGGVETAAGIGPHSTVTGSGGEVVNVGRTLSVTVINCMQVLELLVGKLSSEAIQVRVIR